MKIVPHSSKKALLERSAGGGKPPPPMLCIAGYSGSGKTTVTVDLVAALRRRGLTVGTIKHDVHGFEMDRPGKDSWRHKQAGAGVTVVTSPNRIGMVMDVEYDHQPAELLPLMTAMDIVLVEGFKRSGLPKIEVFRPGIGKKPACKGDRNLLALVSDAPLDWGVPRYSPSAIEALCGFILIRLLPLFSAENGCRKAVCS